MSDKTIIRIGPKGVEYGSSWDEKGHSEMVQIFISHDDEKICSIQFQYLEKESLVLSKQHGELSSTKFDTIKLDYPEEYITSISGTRSRSYSYSSGSAEQLLSSLSIGTNLRNYGPFGNGGGDTEFCYHLGKDRQFNGFCGSGNTRVNYLGVYLKPLTTLDATEKQKSKAV